MSKASEIIVLCEDRLQDVFVRRFLKQGWGIKTRRIRMVPYPQTGSGGAGEKHVRDTYPNELRAYRDRAANARTILITVIDADARTVKEHQDELDMACGCVQPPVGVRLPNEAIVHVIPKWHIETWLAYLADVSVSEDRQYKADYGFKQCEKGCHVLIDRLAMACKNREQLANMPDSLNRTCMEFERIRDLL